MKTFIKKDENKYYKVTFSVEYFEKLSKKDEEKIYKILKIISSLGNDTMSEEKDSDYRFFTETENKKISDILKDGVVFKGKGPKKEKKLSTSREDFLKGK